MSNTLGERSLQHHAVMARLLLTQYTDRSRPESAFQRAGGRRLGYIGLLSPPLHDGRRSFCGKKVKMQREFSSVYQEG